MDIESILADNVSRIAAQNRHPFDSPYDYGGFLTSQRAALKEWQEMGKQGQSQYGNDLKKFYAARSLLPAEDQNFNSAKNFYLLNNEIVSRVGERSNIELISIDELNYPWPSVELLENAENIEHIRDLYRLRKRTVGREGKAGINADEARRIKNCLKQGRELYISSRSGSLMVKPLTLFYSITAYAYAVIILNNPVRFKLDSLPGSHGMNYLPESIEAQFGGDMPHGTFSDLFSSFPTVDVIARGGEYTQSSLESIMAFYHNRFTATTGTLLSMVPEIREYYKIATGKASRSHPLEISSKSERRSTVWELQIGDGINRPSSLDIQQAFSGFEITERHGKVIVVIPVAEEGLAKATIYSDIRGRLWYIENPFFPVVLPELCLHFLLTSMFSNLMRYSPDHWGEVLLNQVNTNVSLIISKYLSAIEQKMPVLLLRSFSKFYPIVSSEG